VVTRDVVLEDAARGRTLETRVWLPDGAPGGRPLVVFSHGFLSDRSGGTYLAEHLASHGWVFVAATHPRTTFFAPGGPEVADVVQQPGDVTLLIDRMLDGDAELAREARVDPKRIAVVGHSLGGLTATLAAFHPRLRDPRIAAAVSIAGPLSLFAPGFFRTADVPFLMIVGSYDVIVDYRTNAFVTLERVPRGSLVLIAGGSHTGFDDAIAGLPRTLDNPDALGCRLLGWKLDLDAAQASLPSLARPGDLVALDGDLPAPCTTEPPDVALDPVRQQVLTELAVRAFLDSRLAPEPAARASAARYLRVDMPRDLPEVSFAADP
jgi:predicted dienelactone hydrolase